MAQPTTLTENKTTSNEVKIVTDKTKIQKILARSVEEIIVREDLEKKLFSGRQLRVKHGVDPTTRALHIGHAIIYRKLREFQTLGHKIVFLIGGFTARFGDPTEKIEARKMRSKEEVSKVAKQYIKQVSKILDMSKVEARDNSEWYDKMTAEDLLKLLSKFTTDRMLERDMFVERKKHGKEIRYHEPVYPMLQGYDSVMLKSDFTVIGTDQLFNELQARSLQKEAGQAPQDIVAVPMLVGTDGKRKMSQSLENHIGLAESPKEQYGKIMSIPDEIIWQYFELCTDVPREEINKMKKAVRDGANPRDFKMALARQIVTMYHSKKSAQKAEENFIKVFARHEAPHKIKTLKIKAKSLGIVDLLIKIGLVKSKSDARRVIEQRGIKADGKVIKDSAEQIRITEKGVLIQKGKRHFVKVIPHPANEG